MKTRSRGRSMRRLALAVLAGGLTLAAAGAASAHDGWHRHWHPHHPRGYVYVAPPAVYVPPPVYYAPPPPPPPVYYVPPVRYVAPPHVSLFFRF